MNAEKSSWAQAGITMNLSQQSFNTVIGNSVPCSGADCTWELRQLGRRLDLLAGLLPDR